jgi:hypothetical protein
MAAKEGWNGRMIAPATKAAPACSTINSVRRGRSAKASSTPAAIASTLPATVRNQRFSSVRVTWSGCNNTHGADAISTTATTKKRPASTATTRKMITRTR